MKKTILIILLIILGSSVLLLLPETGYSAPVANVAVKVVDESGVPIENAEVSIKFNIYQTETVFTGKSDRNGVFSAQGENRGPHVNIVVDKEGYYRSLETYMIKTLNRDKNRYEPWGDVRTLVLRRKVDIKEGVEGSAGKIDQKTKGNWPLFDQKVGFDFMMNDWVEPHGKGKTADFILESTYNADKKFYAYTINFSGKGNGILNLPRIGRPYGNHSEFRWPYKAPLDGYVNMMKRKYTWQGGDSREFPEHQEISNTEHKKMDYIFRIRTQYDEEGKITKAFYGKSKGPMEIHPRDGLRFSYWLNVDPLSRSLESTYKYWPY